MKIVVTGHGNFATGLESTVKLLSGGIEGIEYIDFTAEMSEEDLGKKFRETIENDAVFFCDLVGGTPYKQAAILKSERANIAVIAGGNIGALLEVGLSTGFSESKNSNALADNLIEISKSGIQQFGTKKFVEQSEEDGI